MTRSSLKWFAWFALILGLCAAAAADPRGWQRYFKLRDEVQRLQDKNRVAARENQHLLREVRALRDNPAAIERAARQELGFIHPGEIVLQLRAAAAPPAPGDALKATASK